MSRLSDVRKKAIEVHIARSEATLKSIRDMAESMDKVGLAKGSEELYTIASSLQFNLNSLSVSAEIDKKPD